MVGLLFVIAIIALVTGGFFLTVAQSAIHEIEAFILFLIGAVLIGSASIVEAINRAVDRVKPKRVNKPDTSLDGV